MLDDHRPLCRSRHRWFQFGLSTLLLVTLLAAALVAWQRERLARWVESLLPAKEAEPSKDPRDPRQVVLDFVDLACHRKPDDAEELLSPAAREVFHRLQLRADLDVAIDDERLAWDASAAEVSGDHASVKMTWIAAGPHGGVGQAETTGILRKESQGWRITGVILPRSLLVPPQHPSTPSTSVTLDFESEQVMRELFRIR